MTTEVAAVNPAAKPVAPGMAPKPAEPVAPPKPPEMSTMERIKILGELANAVQDETLRKTILALPSGERLIQIFTEAISKEIDNMINPGNKKVPKELMDTISAATGLRNLIDHTYAMMAEINRAPVLGVLNILNQNMGGNGIQQFQQEPASAAGQTNQGVVRSNQQQARQQHPAVGDKERGVEGMW